MPRTYLRVYQHLLGPLPALSSAIINASLLSKHKNNFITQFSQRPGPPSLRSGLGMAMVSAPRQQAPSPYIPSVLSLEQILRHCGSGRYAAAGADAAETRETPSGGRCGLAGTQPGSGP